MPFKIPKKLLAEIEKSEKPGRRRSNKTPLSVDGLVADSATEAAFFEMMKTFSDKFNVPFSFQKEIALTSKSVPKNKKVPLLRDSGIREITLTVDFVVKYNQITHFLDTKGAKESTTDYSRLKYHLLKHQLKKKKRDTCSCIKFIYANDVKRLCLIGHSCIAKGNMAEFFAELDKIDSF